MLLFLIQGIIIGAIISIPIGPVNVICLQSTMKSGKVYGFKSTIGATIADTIYAIIACFGLSLFIDFINEHKSLFELLSGIVITGFGLLLLRKDSIELYLSKHKSEDKSTAGLFKSFFFTISNPLTVLFFIAYLAYVNKSNVELTSTNATMFVLGVIIGSLAWFYSLASIIARFKEKINLKHINIINILCALLLMISGLALIIKFFTN